VRICKVVIIAEEIISDDRKNNYVVSHAISQPVSSGEVSFVTWKLKKQNSDIFHRVLQATALQRKGCNTERDVWLCKNAKTDGLLKVRTRHTMCAMVSLCRRITNATESLVMLRTARISTASSASVVDAVYVSVALTAIKISTVF